MPGNFADNLLRAVDDKNSRVCVGLDPRLEHLPAFLLEREGSPAAAVVTFCDSIIRAVVEHTAVVKVQAAFFEALGRSGLDCLWEVVLRAQQQGLIVILDGKRGDIGSTAEAYAQAYLGGEPSADAVTVNPYLGSDGVIPFLSMAHDRGKGVFVLVKTSNPSSGELQDLRLEWSGTPVYLHLGESVRIMGAGVRGESGYSSVGAVVGATYPEQLLELRRRLPGVPFLVPGFGAQGAGPEDVVGAFDEQGRGAIINAARSIIFAYRDSSLPPERYARAAEEAARAMKDDINAALERRRG